MSSRDRSERAKEIFVLHPMEKGDHDSFINRARAFSSKLIGLAPTGFGLMAGGRLLTRGTATIRNSDIRASSIQQYHRGRLTE